MREIRFRSWDKIRKEMLYSDTQKDFDKMLIHWDFINGWSATRAKDRFVLSNANAVLMQYTGLKDKNGKEIYEGDIILYSGNDSCGKKVNPTKLEIKWNEKGCWNIGDIWGYTGEGFYDLYTAEIIGNLYENPELLNQ
jgi:uncharacterized phage protein (TIGR01671 family)